MARNFSLFGFTISREKTEEEKVSQQSFSPPPSDDGALTIQSAAYYGTAVDMDGTAKNEVELISRYREMAMQPEIESAIDDIVNEAICQDDDGKIIQIILDDLSVSDKIKKAIKDEFATVLRMLNYTNMAQDIFRRYYVDGKLYYHVIINKENPTDGIKELRYVDPRKLRKVREIKKQKDDLTGVEVMNTVNEYYIFNDKVSTGTSANYGPVGTRITTDSIISVVSGLMDSRRAVVLSYLHKAIKPLNMLRMIEDATVIYRICLVGNTRVKTNDGYKYIKDIKEGDTVYSFNAQGIFPASVKSAWSNGVKPVFKVKSKHHAITGTATHPILVFDKNTNVVEYVDIDKIDINKHHFVWDSDKPYKDIKIPKIHNDAIKLLNPDIWVNVKIDNKESFIENLAESLNIKHSSIRNFLYGQQYLEKNVALDLINTIEFSEQPIFDTKTEGHCKNQLNLPEYVTDEFARLFGFLLGDGSLSKNTIVFAEGEHDIINDFYSAMLEKFFGNCTRYPSGNRKYSNYTTSSTLGVDVLRAMGWIDGTRNKRIPSWVFQAPNEIKRQFVLGLSDADGSVKYNEVTNLWSSEISLCNEKLVEDIKELWTSIGLASGHIKKRVRDAQFRVVGDEKEPRMMPETESWTVYISNKQLQRFEKILSIEPAGEEEVFDLEVDSEKHNFIANGVVVHNSRAPERRIFYIDVGNLPKLKAEQYLHDIMIKYKNKLVYDACLAMDTMIPLLDGRVLPLYEIQKEFEAGKELWVYSCDPVTGKFAPGLVSSAGITAYNQPVMKLTLDNGKTITCTYDHKFPVWNKGKVEAKDLIIGDSMMKYLEESNSVIIESTHITNIEYLQETMDVGTLGIDKDEKYHSYHTFALDVGIYTCNSTGEIRDDRKFLSMMEDFWLPRREGSSSTEIDTLPGGQNLSQIDDVKYFEKKLYKSLNVPIGRIDPDSSGFSLGRVGEITRDELKFAKFVSRLRNKFSDLFDQALRVQCVLKGICTDDEWKQFKEHIHYNFIKDNNFTELKEAELMKERLSLLGEVDPYTGRYFSQAWIQRNVLRLDDDEIKVMQSEIEKEKEAGLGLPVTVTTDVAQQTMLAQIDREGNEHQNELDMKLQKLDQSKEKNPKNEDYTKVINTVKQLIKS